MDQTHGTGIGGWDPSSFAGETWNQQFAGSGLGFDQGAGGDSSYPNPDFLDGGAMDPQLSGADPQAGMYRPYEYYGQGDVWSGHPQPTAAPFAQDPSLQQQGYYGEQRHPTDANQAIDSRFTLGIQQENEFPSQLHSASNQQANSHHGFGHGVANGPGSAPNGYSQESTPQWQEQVPAGYGSGRQYENPLTAAQTSNISAPVSNGSHASFFPGHGAGASTMSGYQTEMHQHAPRDVPQVHPQFAATLNGQSRQPVPVASSPHAPAQVPARKATPQQHQQQIHQQAAQHTPQHAIPQQQPSQQSAQRPAQQPVQQPVQQPAQQPVQQSAQQPVQQLFQQSAQQPIQQPAQRPALHPAPQPGVGQHVFAQHPQQSAENTFSAGVKRGPSSEPQPPQGVAKKAKVLVAAAASSPSPSAQAQPQNVSDTICTINYRDASLVSSARGRPGARWGGVPNLVIGSAPVKLQKGTPTKRYVTLSTKGGKDPLFTKHWRAWTPAESLGNHADAYQKATNDLEFQRADIRLEIEMQRGANGLLTLVAFQSKRLDAPAEPICTDIKAVELLRFHPAHLRNQNVAKDACAEFGTFLQTKAGELKTALQAASDKPQAVQAAAKARTAKVQLERAIAEGLEAEPGNLFAGLSGSSRLVAVLNNVLVRLVNAGEANSSLAKVILRLYTRLTRVTSDQLEKLQMDKMRKKFGKEGDAETKALMAQVYDNASYNDDYESESESDSPGAESGARGKKAAPAQTRILSKQTAPGSDLKKTTTSSASKLATSTADSRKLSSALASSKTMASSNEPNKGASKATQKVPSTATGTKRSREDDAAGAEVRSSKKPATDTSSANSAKASSSGPKSLALAAGKTTIAKPSATTATSGSAVAQTKPRAALLLPGKARPAPKPAAPKPELARAEAQKSATKSESTLKAQPTPTAASAAKTAKPKPAEATKQVSATNSIFTSVMNEILADDDEKKIRTPAANGEKVDTPDPNETPQERERRLRKAKRRSLRVAFKSGDALEEIREFTRHPEEIADGRFARNARTDGRNKNSEESEMMKRLHGGQGIKAVEINDREWEEPIAINFTTIPQEKREETYITRGGLKAFATDEQKLTKERESNELMVIYHNRADIPHTPRSPPYEPSLSGGNAAHEVHLSPATPEYSEMLQRGKECKQWGPHHASRAAQSRLETKARPDYADFTKTMQSINSIADSYSGQAARQPEVHPHQPAVQPAVRDPRLWYEPTVAARRDQQTHELLASDRAKNWKDPDPHNQTLHRMSQHELDNDPKLQKVLANLQAIAASVHANRTENPVQATPAPQPAQQEAPQPVAVAVQETQAAAVDHSVAWAQYYAAQQQQQQAWYAQQQNSYTQAANPYLQAHATQAAQQQQTADSSLQYASILAALGIQQPAAQSQSPPTADQNTQIQAALMALAAGNQGQAAAPTPADPQSTQHLLDMMKLAANQNQAQYPYAQPAQGYASSRQERDGYGQGYGQSHQEREAHGQVHGSGGQERERDSFSRDRAERDRDHHRGTKGRNNGGKNEYIPEHLRGINRSLIGTKACAFWAKGQCAKGDKCTFRHD
ncbi:hypothetical protein C8A00DRAFT_15929 [Chaetomidium leptoderma]|uniref:C3H1-type domain-containing protein n=1 Tax=Chaetomidium leptoderma TaxID=669021 RepID=A0AAN6VKA3_9PEZI|nr:hypothetical protein C8A00DRAFT_15929 [Chaetomidium leptoderma]